MEHTFSMIQVPDFSLISNLFWLDLVEKIIMSFGAYLGRVFGIHDDEKCRCYLRCPMFDELQPQIVYPTDLVFGDAPEKVRIFVPLTISQK